MAKLYFEMGLVFNLFEMQKEQEGVQDRFDTPSTAYAHVCS
jgi:hypothetical protein